jgi:hypothetical protein
MFNNLSFKIFIILVEWDILKYPQLITTKRFSTSQ